MIALIAKNINIMPPSISRAWGLNFLNILPIQNPSIESEKVITPIIIDGRQMKLQQRDI